MRADKLEEALMMRRSFIHSVSPAERNTVAKWARGMAALYASIAVLAVMGVALAQHRGDSGHSQVVNLRPLQVN
jgi:hypothetical protein